LDVAPIPGVAIGEITAETAGALAAAGADFVAVSGTVWNAGDREAATVAAPAAAIAPC
jgi:thiamine-phosphate pyrophosphorylase